MMGQRGWDQNRLRMLLVGYCFGICSERRLCEELHLNLAYRWFCRLGPEDAVPDHSTFSKNRHGRFRQSGKDRSKTPKRSAATANSRKTPDPTILAVDTASNIGESPPSIATK